MRGERSGGSGGGGRAAMQRRRNEGRRWWQYGGGFILYGLVNHQKQTRIGCIAQRRSQEPTKKLRRPASYYGPHRRRQGTVRMEVALKKDGRHKSAYYGERAEERYLRTSYRALSTENGFSAKPTATRIVAPARRFPELVSTGRTEECLLMSRLRTAAKRGETAMKPRT